MEIVHHSYKEECHTILQKLIQQHLSPHHQSILLVSKEALFDNASSVIELQKVLNDAKAQLRELSRGGRCEFVEMVRMREELIHHNNNLIKILRRFAHPLNVKIKSLESILHTRDENHPPTKRLKIIDKTTKLDQRIDSEHTHDVQVSEDVQRLQEENNRIAKQLDDFLSDSSVSDELEDLDDKYNSLISQHVHATVSEVQDITTTIDALNERVNTEHEHDLQLATETTSLEERASSAEQILAPYKTASDTIRALEVAYAESLVQMTSYISVYKQHVQDTYLMLYKLDNLSHTLKLDIDQDVKTNSDLHKVFTAQTTTVEQIEAITEQSEAIEQKLNVIDQIQGKSTERIISIFSDYATRSEYSDVFSRFSSVSDLIQDLGDIPGLVAQADQNAVDIHALRVAMTDLVDEINSYDHSKPKKHPFIEWNGWTPSHPGKF